MIDLYHINSLIHLDSYMNAMKMLYAKTFLGTTQNNLHTNKQQRDNQRKCLN